MMSRRAFLLTMTTGLVALAVLAAPVVADELLGILTKVDVEGKKVMVLPTDSEKEVEVTVTDDTDFVSPKGVRKIDLAKLAKAVEKAQGKGRKGINVVVTHENAKASKIAVAKKKEAPKSQD